jgi:hypothetical protein
MMRRTLVAMVVVSAALAAAAGAGAYWSASGAGAGLSTTGSLARVGGVATSAPSIVAVSTFTVTWSPLAVPPGAGVVYVVTRHVLSTASTVCTTAAAECTLTDVPDGKAVYTVTAEVNGWTGPESDPTASVKVSTVAPAITSGPASGTAQKTASFTFTHPAFHAFRCRLDGGAPADCAGSAAYAGLTAGTHTFQVQAADADGGLTAAATWTWTITG